MIISQLNMNLFTDIKNKYNKYKNSTEKMVLILKDIFLQI